MDIPQGYKHTELGIIPEDWALQSVGKHCIVKARIGWQGLRSDEYLESGEYALITSTDIIDGTINWNTCYFVDKSRYLQDHNIIVQEDDTLISKDGTIGKVGIVQNIPFPSTLNSGVFVVRPKLDNVYKKYLAFAFKSIYFQDFINRLTAGSTIVHLYQKDIIKFVFPVPPIAEQRVIAEALSDVDGLIAALDKKIAKKRLLKQGAMQQLLTGTKRLPGFSDEWVEKKLGEICSIIMGQSPSSEYYNTQNRGLPLIQGNADLENRQQVVRFYTLQITKECEKGDVILSVRAPVGAVGKATHKSCLGRGVCAIKTDNDFLYHYLVYIENDWSSFSKGSTFDSINSDELYQLSLVLPQTKKEQQAIATILSDMDKEIADLEAQRDKYRLLKSGMMQKLLTGQIRLKIE